MKKILQKITNSIVLNIGLLLRKLSKPGRKNNLCVIRTDGIGDFILFTPGLKYLRQRFKDKELVLVLNNRVKELSENHPYIDRVISFDRKKYLRNIFYKFRFLLKIKRHGFSVCINPLYSRERVSDEIALWTNANSIIGWDNPLIQKNPIYSQVIKSDLPEYAHELKRNREFLDKMGISIESFEPQIFHGINKKQESGKLKDVILPDGKDLIAIVPGALSEKRRWGSNKFSELILKISHLSSEIHFIIIGNTDDKDLLQFESSDPINKYLSDLCGKIPLSELGLLFKKCKLVIGNETGPMHIAICSGVPTVTILGGGHYGRFMPWGSEKSHKAVVNSLDCFKCDWDCIKPEIECILGISVNMVMKEVNYFLK